MMMNDASRVHAPMRGTGCVLFALALAILMRFAPLLPPPTRYLSQSRSTFQKFTFFRSLFFTNQLLL
jgi:hypothetical protein